MTQRLRRGPLPIPQPSSAKPGTGRRAAYHIPDEGRKAPVLTGRGLVSTVKVDCNGVVLLVEEKGSGLVENAEVAFVGTPETESETLLVKLGSGETTT